MESALPQAQFSEILVFTQVVRCGSFTAAASNLGMPKSTVSRKLADLEERLGARLLHRTTRSMSLTDAGQVFYAHCSRILAELEEAELAVSQMQGTPRGILRLSIPFSFSVLGPLLAEYLQLYPEVQVEILSTERRVDLVEERFDLALRAGASPDTSLIGRKLGTVRRSILAAPELLEKTGPLQHPRDLEVQPCLAFAPEGPIWVLTQEAGEYSVQLKPRLVVNDYDFLRAVTRAGQGFALLPEFQCLEDVSQGRLIPVLHPWVAPEIPLYALYPAARHIPAKVTAFLDLLRDRLALTLQQNAAR